MTRRIQFFSTTGLLTTMQDTNAVEMTFPKILDTIKGMFPDEVVHFFTIDLAIDSLAVRNDEWNNVATIYLF